MVPYRGPQFNLGGDRVSGMDLKKVFTMVQQIYIFFQLLGHCNCLRASLAILLYVNDVLV